MHIAALETIRSSDNANLLWLVVESPAWAALSPVRPMLKRLAPMIRVLGSCI